MLRLATGQKTELFRFPEGAQIPAGGTNLAVSPDERMIVYVQTDRDESDLMLNLTADLRSGSPSQNQRLHGRGRRGGR